MIHWFVYYMLKASVLMQILINSFCSDLISIQLLESHLHSFTQIFYSDLTQILLISCSDFAQISCSNLLLCQHLLTWESSYSDILLRSCSDLTQILFNQHLLTWESSYSDILFKSYSDILLKSYSNILFKSCSNLAQIYLLCQYLLTWESSCSDLNQAKYLSKKCILLLVFCFLYHASYSRCSHTDMCILLWIIRSHCVVYTHSVMSLIVTMIFFFQVEWWWWLRVSELSWLYVICWLWLLISDLWHDQE